ncbi:alpha/beta hydrolase [Flaviaesturariibacter amylovorans]|uniref:Alpha/beta hydrolase-fold protein n=1 Tax=Flaviaesturariibacter amylovorans TaxID=1084520 RepID=A0ABP8GFW8_9BACT
MKRLFSFLLLLISTLVRAQVPKVSSGSIQRLEAFPSKYVDARNIDVWLPDGYPAAGTYAVLYMHDGQMLFDSTITWNRQEWRVDETAGRLQREGLTIPFIVVAIPNHPKYRFAEYFPSIAAKVMSVNLTRIDSLRIELQGRVRSFYYMKFLTEELKPYIDRHFATYTDAAHTFIAGSSMGGLISLYGFTEYPKVFGGAACLSTHWPGSLKRFSGTETNFPYIKEYVGLRLKKPGKRRLYFDRGDRTLDSFYAPFQPVIDSIAKKREYGSRNYRTLVFPGADHSERAWAARLEEPLLFLFGRRKDQ